MEIKINLFAALRDAAGMPEVKVAWKPGMTCNDVLELLKNNFQSMTPLLEHSLVAVNGSYAGFAKCLGPEDEIALLPPVSGG